MCIQLSQLRYRSRVNIWKEIKYERITFKYVEEDIF